MSITIAPGAIKRLCDKEEISRNQLAHQIGVTPETAYRVERGRTHPSNFFIGALLSHVAKVYGGTPEQHFGHFFAVTA